MNRDIMIACGLHREVAHVDAGLCATCNDKPELFRDDLSRKEYSISGMCQTCQDDVFGIKEDYQMLKQDATWEQIQNAWDRMSHNQKAIVAARFDRNLKKSRPDIHSKLTDDQPTVRKQGQYDQIHSGSTS